MLYERDVLQKLFGIEHKSYILRATFENHFLINRICFCEIMVVVLNHLHVLGDDVCTFKIQFFRMTFYVQRYKFPGK